MYHWHCQMEVNWHRAHHDWGSALVVPILLVTEPEALTFQMRSEIATAPIASPFLARYDREEQNVLG